MVGTGMRIPDRDAEQIGIPARRFLSSTGDFVLLVDDLEASRSDEVDAVFDRYRVALDTMLREDMSAKAAVHFLVNMLEAYYFADAKAVNEVLGTDLEDFDGDVETIGHSKNELKALHARYDEGADRCASRVVAVAVQGSSASTGAAGHTSRDPIVAEADGCALASIYAKRVERPGVVALSAPGGRIEVGESAEAYAIREVHEEVGIRVQSLSLRALLRYHDPAEGIAMAGYAFVLSDFRGADAPSAEADPFWCRMDEIPYDEMWENDRIWLPRVLKGERIRADFRSCRGRLVAHTVISDTNISV